MWPTFSWLECFCPPSTGHQSGGPATPLARCPEVQIEPHKGCVVGGKASNWFCGIGFFGTGFFGTEFLALVPRHRDFDRLGGEAVFVLPAVRQSGWPPGRMAAIDPSRTFAPDFCTDQHIDFTQANGWCRILEFRKYGSSISMTHWYWGASRLAETSGCGN